MATVTNRKYERESEVISRVRSVLNTAEGMGDVIWWERLQSGVIPSGPHFIRACRAGTPDFIALIRNKSRSISVLFIECKSKTGKQSTVQEVFQNRYITDDIHYLLVRDPLLLKKEIYNLCFDRTETIDLKGVF